MSISSETTNPADDLLAFFRLLAQKASSEAGSVVLCKLIDCSENDPFFYFSLSVFKERCRILKDIITKDDCTKKFRDDILLALEKLSQSFSVGSLSDSWNNTVNRCINKETLIHLQTVSAAFGNRYSMVRFENSDRVEVLKKIDEALKLITAEAPNGSPLHAALSLLRKMIDKFDLFGPEALRDKLNLAYIEVKAVEKSGIISKDNVLKCANILMAILNIACFVNDRFEAVEGLYNKSESAINWMLEDLRQTQKTLEPPMKQLPKPSGTSENLDAITDI